MTSMLDNADQLATSDVIQLGNADDAYEVLYGFNNKFDVDKKWRSIALVVPASAIPIFAEADANSKLSPFLKTSKDGRQYIIVKISDATEIVGKQAIERGDQCILIVRPEKWAFQGREGVSLRVIAVKVLERKSYTFL